MRLPAVSPKTIVVGLACWSFGLLIALYFSTRSVPEAHAITCMTLGLLAVWGCIGGLFTAVLLRVSPEPWPVQYWRIKFIVTATILALIEEAVAVSMSNLSVKLGGSEQTMITASGNYLITVTQHSVIVFIPMFIAWSWLLSQYRFPPFSVFLLFGVTGWLSESLAFGFNLLSLPQWTIIYGLMIYYPAVKAPAAVTGRVVNCKIYILAVCLPIALTVPIALILMLF